MHKRVTLKPITHKGRSCLSIEFVFDFELKEYIKRFDGVRWSFGKSYFYLLFNEAQLAAFKQYLLEGGCEVVVYETQQVVRSLKDVSVGLPPLHMQKVAIHKKYVDFLIGRRYSKNTVAVYSSFILDFLRFSGHKRSDKLDAEDVRLYLEWATKQLNYSVSTHRQAISALKLFTHFYPKCAIDPEAIAMPKRDLKLPVVLSQQEVMSILQATRNLKHRSALAMLYGSGLRIGELIDLKLESFDFHRRLLHVRNAKGRKDRYASIAESCIPLLQNYYATYKPKVYFLENPGGGQYSAGSVRNFLKTSCKLAGITKKVTPHTLRHSYATHLLEAGTDIRYIQELLGHSRPETTMVYTHVQRKDLQTIRSPLDQLVMDQAEKPAPIEDKKNALMWPGFRI